MPRSARNPIARTTFRVVLMAWLAAFATWAAAGLPVVYQPVVITPTGLPERAEFDLRPAIERARAEGLRLYLYLGARDCPFCRRYEAFLDSHANELRPHFAGYLLVDLRSSLKVGATSVVLHTTLGRQTYAEFQAAIGDERQRLVYPTVWLLDGKLKPLMQMPQGAGTFLTVPEQIDILRAVR
jgi:hypothetical protein